MKSFIRECSLIIVLISSASIVHAAENPPIVDSTVEVPISKAELRAKYDIAQGKGIYERVCSACHSSGVMDAPKFCDLTDWKPRMAHGMEHLVKHAIDGFNNMPSKGGMESLTVTESANAVAYMVDQCLIESK
jgi:cytochrome c5